MTLNRALKEGLITEKEYLEGVSLAWKQYGIALDDARRELEERIEREVVRKNGNF